MFEIYQRNPKQRHPNLAASQKFKVRELQDEKWREVVGYEGLYSVSSIGRVRRDLTRTSTTAGRILKPNCNTWGYLYVGLSKDGKMKSPRIHQLVARAFIGECPQGKEINHIDASKINNRVENLEYVTKSENVIHAYKMGKNKPRRGDSNSATKIADADALGIFELRASGLTQYQIAEILGVTQAHVSNILNGKKRRHIYEQRRFNLSTPNTAIMPRCRRPLPRK